MHAVALDSLLTEKVDQRGLPLSHQRSLTWTGDKVLQSSGLHLFKIFKTPSRIYGIFSQFDQQN